MTVYHDTRIVLHFIELFSFCFCFSLTLIVFLAGTKVQIKFFVRLNGETKIYHWLFMSLYFTSFLFLEIGNFYNYFLFLLDILFLSRPIAFSFCFSFLLPWLYMNGFTPRNSKSVCDVENIKVTDNIKVKLAPNA